MARSFRLWEQTVDVGPHRFFSHDRRVNKLWLGFAGQDYVMVRRLTRILYRKRFFQYPLRPLDVLAKLGPLEAGRCVASYAGEQLSPTWQDGSFEAWVRSRFGQRLFGLFFKTYSEKLWGIPCAELDADFAAQRIRKFSLSEAVRTAFFPKRGQHRTLVDEFAYPTGGSGMVYERMAESIRRNGGEIHLNTPVKRVLVENQRVKGIELMDGTVRPADQVVSTMPLTQLVERLPGVPDVVRDAARKLTFRNTILVYLEVAGKNLFPDNWIYVHSPELKTGRITNFRNWAPEICGESPNTILALEYWCNEEDGMWRQPDNELVALAGREALATGLVKHESLLLNGQVLRVPKCYPVYRRGYRELLKPIREYLSGIQGLQVIGRYGSFKYNNQDHSILMGLLAAENITKNAGHDLWEVNSDYETYQEECAITATGLVPTGRSAAMVGT